MKKFLLFTLLLCHFAWAKETLILAIHSYDELYPWTKGQRTGFRSVVNTIPNLYPHYSVEYLDTKRRELDPEYEREIVHYMKQKYKGYQPELIYATDDNALKFVIRNREKLFTSVPVVFSGLNDKNILASLDKRIYTGVLEEKEIIFNLKLIKTLFPKEQEVVFISDDSSTAKSIREKIDQDVRAVSGIRIRYIQEKYFESALSQLKTFKGKAVVLGTIGGFHTKNGHLVPLNEAIDVFTHAGDFVMLSLEDTNIMHGVIGGHADSSITHGTEAGKMALQIFAHPEAPLPKIHPSTHDWIFDKAALSRYSIVLPDKIEAQSTFLNEPESFYRRHEKWMSVLFYGFGTFIFLGSMVFTWYLQRSRKMILQREQDLFIVSNRLNKAQAITHLGNWEWDIKANTLWWSDEIYRIFGVEPQGFLPTYASFFERVHPDDHKMVEEALKYSLEHHTDYLVEHRILKTDRAQRFVLEEGQLELNDSGEPVKMTGTVHDITEHRKAQVQLEEKEEQLEMFAKAIKQTDDLVKIVNKKGIIIFVNDSIVKHSGYSREDLIGANTRIFKSDHHDKAFYKILWETISAGGTYRNTFINKRKDGSLFYEEESITPVFAHDGEIDYYIATGKDITKRVEIERALHTSEANFRNIFDNSSDGIVIHDLQGVILEVNQVICKRLGFTREELIGQHLTFIDTPKAQKNIPEAIRSLQEDGHAMIEGEHRKKDGTVIPVEIHANVIEHMQHPAVLSVVRDITERKASEQAIVEAEELYHTMFDLSPVGILLVDFNTGKAVEFNKNAYESLGYTEEEFAQLHISDYEAKETPEETAVHLEVLRAGHQEVFETRHFTKKGEIRNVIVSTQLISLHGTQYLFALFHDITTLKENEQKLNTLSIRLSLATKAASMGVWEWDLESNMLTWDEQMYRLYGMDQATGEHPYTMWHDAVDPEDINRAEASLQGAIRGESDYNTQFWITTPQNERRFMQAMGTVELDGEGKSIRVVGVNWDITQQKEYEKALEEAKKSAELANSAKSNFLANMSHEIRTPMNAILGLTQLTHSLDLSPQAQDYLGKIEKSSQLLLHIINDILDFSKIEANRLEITPATFEFGDVIEQISALFGPKSDAKGVEFTINIAPNTPARLVGDSLRLSQVLNNLISNAVKFTHAGQVEVSVCVLKSNKKTISLQFKVKDTGIGIAAEDHHKLFELFSQVDGSITRKFGGTGLGLSISKRLVELMGGKIGFDSEPGVGSCFKFELEFGMVDAQTYSQADSPLTKGMDILVVDDQESAREILKEMLTTWNCHVDESQNGEDALNKITKRLREENPYDLIIVDWSMPGLNGVETIQAIRAMEQKEEVAHLIMMVTAYSRDLVLNSTSEQIVDAFLNKPVTYSSLYDSFSNLGLYTKIQPLQTNKSDSFMTITAPIRGSSVLLVEDNEINIQVESDFLRQMGIQVTVVTDGLQAVQLLENHRFDAVLMDYQMPVMDGIEATEVLRSRGDTIPIIAMTAAAMQGDKERCLKAGMNDYLAKPIDIMKMAYVLAQWIAPREQDREMNFISSVSPLSEGLPKEIEGMNLHEGLKNSANNPQLYVHVLKQFSQQYTLGCKPLVEMLEQQQLKEAKRWVHTLKGTSATIGASGVHEQAVIVEGALDNSEAVEMLCRRLSALTEGLKSLEEELLSGVNVFDYGVVTAGLNTISEKLIKNQLVEPEDINSVKGALGDYVTSSSWKMLLEALDNFEYDRAQKLTDTLRHQIEENHESLK